MSSQLPSNTWVCNNSGHCCTPFLAVTQEELDTIKQYIIDHNIEEQVNLHRCPFRDETNHTCLIYEIRPHICQVYSCGINQGQALKEAYYAERQAEGIDYIYNFGNAPFVTANDIFYPKE